MPEMDLEILGERLAKLIVTVVTDLGHQSQLSREIDLFVAEKTEICSKLEARVEATTVAKAGLDAILTAYKSRYGSSVDDMDDVKRFRAILAEKIRLLDSLKVEMDGHAREVEELLMEVGTLQNRSVDSLTEVEQTLFAVKATKQAGVDALRRDRATIRGLVDRFWSVEGRSEEMPHINLSEETLDAVVGNVVGTMDMINGQRHDLIAEVMSSIKNDDIRRALADKMDETT